MISWQNGQFDVLMSECRILQKNLKTNKRSTNPDNVAKTFAMHVLNGKINAALRLLDTCNTSGVLNLNQNVIDQLRAKHPQARDPEPSVLMKGEVPFVDPAQFNVIDESAIYRAISKTRDSSGSSGLDANQWR